MAFYGGLSKEHLNQFVERIERLEEEKTNISTDIKEVYAEAKGNGFDVKALRKIISIRKMDDNDREEQDMIIDTYMRALGMLPDIDDDVDQEEQTELVKLAG